MWVNQAKLPSEYQEVEYIQSSGSQYINTGYNPDNNTNVECKVNMQPGATYQFPRVFGVRNGQSGTSERDFCLQWDRDNKQFVAVTYNNSDHSYQIMSSTLADNTDYVVKQTNTQLLVNGVSQGTVGTKTFSISYPVWLFNDNQAGTDFDRKAKMKLYRFKMYNGTTLVRNFVPCYRKSDNVIGMYDLVNSAFYTNAGSGTFSKGNDVTMVEKQVYPAGWKPNANTLIYYPLTSNLVDQMGNGNTGTMHGTCTFDSSTGIHVTGKSGNYITGMSNGIANRNTFTMNVWEKLDQTGKTQCILGYNNTSPSSQCMYINHEGDGYRGVGFFGSSWNYCTIGNLPIDTNWHNVCLLATGTSYQWYIDGVAYGTAALSSNNMNNYPELQLGWGGVYGSNRAANGYIKDYIVETVARTSQEIQNYYNQTKSNYGL